MYDLVYVPAKFPILIQCQSKFVASVDLFWYISCVFVELVLVLNVHKLLTA